MAVSAPDMLAWLDALQRVYAENKQYLTDLDAAIGDADHGINLERGFTAAQTELSKTPSADIATLLKTTATVLIRTVGGASGPLYGTFFLRASAACADKAELQAADLVAMFQAGVEGIVQRGKAELGDKTMVDVWLPVVQAMKQALTDGANVAGVMHAGVSAAELGVANTIPLQAKKGRASYLGPRSVGHPDAGATSSYLMLKAALDVWSKS
jgi:dihydroxyacetone kinase-like protein